MLQDENHASERAKPLRTFSLMPKTELSESYDIRAYSLPVALSRDFLKTPIIPGEQSATEFWLYLNYLHS